MSERERLRRLHVENRLAELRAKHGRDLEDEPLPDWLDSLEGFERAHSTPEDAQASAEPAPPPAPASRVLSVSEAMSHLDQYRETPVFGCPRCGEDSAKASLAIDVWHCTACGSGGKASRLAAARGEPPITPVHLA